MARAYPADTISVPQMDAARAAFSNANGRPFPSGRGRPGTWVSVGPSEALYPFTPFRNSFSYVPNAYIAGGRTTAIAISDTCKPGNCRLYVTPAGGGIWRTKNALTGQPSWQYLGGPLGINAAGAVTIDSNDASGNTIYVGTGEANICGSGCVAGVGLYKSTNGGDTWTGPLGQAELGGKGIGAIVIKPGDPNTIYVGSTTALRGMSSVCCSGVTRPVPGAAQWGLYKSTNGGATWTFIHNGGSNPTVQPGESGAQFANAVPDCSPPASGTLSLIRSTRISSMLARMHVCLALARWWCDLGTDQDLAQCRDNSDPACIRRQPHCQRQDSMYVHEGNIGSPYSRLFRSEDVASGARCYRLTSTSTADPGFATFNLCGGQCWYDLFVYTRRAIPISFTRGGSYAYGETIANKRAVILSTDAGVSGTDMTFDGTDPPAPMAASDQHALVTNPNNPYQFFETNDGGIMRSSGELVDRSAWCDDPNRG